MSEKKFIIGILSSHPRGFGFVRAKKEENFSHTIFIPKTRMNNAIDGDTVEIELNENISEKGPEGIVISVLERGRNVFATIVHRKGKKDAYFLFSPLLGLDREIKLKTTKKLEIGDRVLIKLLKNKKLKKKLSGQFIEKLGNIEDPSLDAIATQEEFQLNDSFSHAALKEAKSFGKSVSPIECEDREDLTNLSCITIDPDTAKDFDDAISIKKDKKGNFHLGVHIADVAHYVIPDSPLDKEAIARCNSTYFPSQVLPMIPHDLSSHLCSLKPNVIRLCVSVMMEFDKKASLINYKIFRSFIKSRKRFTYEEASLILKKKKNSPFSNSLSHMLELSKLLRQKRFDRGSIDLSLSEIKIETDKNGIPIEIKVIPYDESHQMIEEFMLKANEVIATHLNKSGKILIYRIHEKPSETSFKDFFQFAKSLGFKLPKNPTNIDIQKLFKNAKNSPFLRQLSINFIRSMQLAFYSPENIGHYGLALEHYCHFTSPIRRYSDLVAQRLLFDEKISDEDLNDIAQLCSKKERNSFHAENSIKTIKKLRFLEALLIDDPDRIYSAMITQVKPYGIVFELTDLLIEGFLHISNLTNDYYIFDIKTQKLNGTKLNQSYYFGKKISVKLLDIDLIHLLADWKIVSNKSRKIK